MNGNAGKSWFLRNKVWVVCQKDRCLERRKPTRGRWTTAVFLISHSVNPSIVINIITHSIGYFGSLAESLLSLSSVVSGVSS